MKANIYYIFISLLVFLFGGSLGSFYKVFVERRERGEDFIFSRSHCDSCKNTLKFYEMIPVFSYIFLRGKCSSCGEKIERENFYLEVLTSLLALLVFIRYKISFETLIVIFILTIAFFIGLIDYKTGYIYNIDLIILLFFVVIYKIFVLGGLIDSLKYSFGMGLIFFLIYFATKMMGLGDVYYSLIMGLLANDLYEAFVLFRDSFISAGLISLILILLKKKTFKDSIAFGPFMTVAIIIFLICRWIMFDRSIKIKLNDGFVNIFEKTKSKEEKNSVPMPYRIYRDGNILDYHHFFYKMGKIFKKLDLNKRDKRYVIFDSSEFIHINYKIPEIDESEIRGFLNLELEDYGDFNLDDYEIFYKKKSLGDNLELSINLVPKDMILKIEEILDKLEVKNYEILPESQTFSKDGKFLEVQSTYIKLISIEDELVKSYEKIYDENIEKIIEDNGLEEKNASNIINLRYDIEEQKVEEDFLFKYKNYFIRHINKIEKFASGDKIYLFGKIADSETIKDLLKSYSNLEYEYLGENLEFNILKTKEKEKNKTKKDKNYVNYILPLAILILIISNLFYYKKLKNENEIISEKIKIQEVTEGEDIDLSSDRFQEKNKKFIEKVSEIQKLEDENLVITSYNFDKGRIIVRGLVKDEDYFNKTFKDIDIVSKNFYKENGFNKFEMQIK